MAVKPLFLNEFYDYDLSYLLAELLNKNEPIKLDSEYVNDYYGDDRATENNIRNFRNCPVFKDLETDMKKFSHMIKRTIKSKFKDVESVKVESSGKLGMSTYITVKFKEPTNTDSDVENRLQNDPQFLTHFLSGTGNNNGLGGEYKLKFRISNHQHHNDTDANIDINAVGKVYNDIKNSILNRVRERSNYIKAAWETYKESGTLPNEQRQRNINRKNALNSGTPQITELLKCMKSYIAKSLKESFGSDRLQAVLEIEAQNVLDYLKFTATKIEDIISAVESEFRDYKVNYVQLIKATAECLVDNIIDYTFEDSFDYDMLFNDIREELDNDIIDENIVSDLKSNDIRISPKVLKNISLDVDIQSANVVPLNIQKWQELKNKYILIANNATNDIIAIYNKDKFDYNPDKLKVNELTDKDLYSCFEVTNISSIRQKHNDRIALKQDYVDLQNSNNEYNKPPKSTRYVFDRDWNPERNKAYYTKLLQQNKLGEYSRYLEEVYDVIENLIDHRRKEKTTGKKLVYSNYIKKLASQIESLETEMDALDKNVNINLDKLKRNLKSLSNSTDLAKEFLRTEDDAIKVWGYPKQRPHRKIER